MAWLFEQAKALASAARDFGRQTGAEDSPRQSFIRGAFAGGCARGSMLLVTTPLDLVNTRLQTQRIFTASGAAANLSSVVDAISRVAAEEGGPTALMRGAGLRAAQYAPSGLLFFCVYEAVKRRAASGGL